ncbi:MAG TPA: GspH/FimT family pseudopilin [Usitatibacter sp.]|nr:GspH/FimT family pseudopilin [Usitatibacter sp.]HST01480.1 GspH/FimT family pseudopilin [Usitatibacter sp.]
MKRQLAGFTLLEVIIVLAMGAIIYAVILSAVPMGKASSGELKAAARSIASGLRTAQTTAMATRHDALLTVDMQSKEYITTGEREARKVPSNIDLKLLTAQTEVESDHRGSIRFYPDGSSTGGRITVSSGERQYLVDVDWLTGRVAIND